MMERCNRALLRVAICMVSGIHVLWLCEFFLCFYWCGVGHGYQWVPKTRAAVEVLKL